MPVIGTDFFLILVGHAKISLEFTDSMPIFIDVSVNGNDFDKFSAAHHLLNHCT